MPLTNFAKNAIVNAVFRADTTALGTTVYAALFTSTTDETGAGNEVVGGGYVRQVVTFEPPLDGGTQSEVIVEFTDLPACTATDLALFDENGNMLIFGALEEPRTFAAGEDFTFSIGEVDLAIL